MLQVKHLTLTHRKDLRTAGEAAQKSYTLPSFSSAGMSWAR